MNKSVYMSVMKADSIPEAFSLPWYIYKQDIPKPMKSERFGRSVICPAGTITYLRRLTESTKDDWPPGELVMEDTPFELATHLGFVMRAYGKVLVTGLGLGCVTRGLLANPKVEHVTVVENSKEVLKLVAPHMPTEKLAIVEDDAFRFVAHNKQCFDCVWHDLWTNKDEGEPHLDVWHMRLLVESRRFATHQGAWALRKDFKRRMIKGGFKWMG